MATYDMVCSKCQNTFEVLRRRGVLRDKDRICPECGSSDTRQTFASFLRNWGSNTNSSSCGPHYGGFG